MKAIIEHRTVQGGIVVQWHCALQLQRPGFNRDYGQARTIFLGSQENDGRIYRGLDMNR